MGEHAARLAEWWAWRETAEVLALHQQAELLQVVFHRGVDLDWHIVVLLF